MSLRRCRELAVVACALRELLAERLPGAPTVVLDAVPCWLTRRMHLAHLRGLYERRPELLPWSLGGDA